jgi:hypothetical protein
MHGVRVAPPTRIGTSRGRRVFAAGAFYFTRLVHVDAVVARIVANLWARLTLD